MRSLRPLSDPVNPWLRVQRCIGEAVMQAKYLETLDGKTSPDIGIILGFG